MELSQAMPKARVEIAHPALAMVGLMIGSFVGMFSETALNIALPSLMTALNVSQGTIQWLVTGYMLVIGICMPLSSLLTKWFTTKKNCFICLRSLYRWGCDFCFRHGLPSRVIRADDSRYRHWLSLTADV